MADGYKLYRLCDVCWGRGVIDRITSAPNEPPTTEEIECPQCLGEKIIFWGWCSADLFPMPDV